MKNIIQAQKQIVAYFRRENRSSIKLTINNYIFGNQLYFIVKEHFFVHEKDAHFKIFYKGAQIMNNDFVTLEDRCILHIAKIDVFATNIKINVKNASKKQVFQFTVNNQTKLLNFIQQALLPMISQNNKQKCQKLLLVAKGIVLKEQSSFKDQYLQNQAEIIFIIVDNKKAASKQNKQAKLNNKNNEVEQMIRKKHSQVKVQLFLMSCPFKFDETLDQTFLNNTKKYKKCHKHCPIDKSDIFNQRQYQLALDNIRYLSQQRPQVSQVFDPFLKQLQFIQTQQIPYSKFGKQNQTSSDKQQQQKQEYKYFPQVIKINQRPKTSIKKQIIHFLNKIRNKLKTLKRPIQQNQDKIRQELTFSQQPEEQLVKKKQVIRNFIQCKQD